MQETTTTCKIQPHHYAWRQRVHTCRAAESALEKWLFVHAASVLFGHKAGELLTLLPNQFDLSYPQQTACMQRVADLWGVAMRTLHRSARSTKIIVYQPHMVWQQLAQVPPCVLHQKLGYAPDVRPDSFLQEVKRRWDESGKIPHEIGFALGYPVKDVLGYMELTPLPCSGCCGWQVYGEFAPSYRLCQLFLQARRQAIQFLHGTDEGH